MKNKAAVGCLTVVVLLGAGGAVGGYAAYRKIRSGLDGFAGLSTVRELDRSVRTQAYAALDLRLMDIDIEQFIDAARTERPPAPLEPVAPPSPSGKKANRTLVAPHRKPIEDYLVLAFLGL